MAVQFGATLTDPSVLSVELKRLESLRRDPLSFSLGNQPEHARRRSVLELRDALISLRSDACWVRRWSFRFFQRCARPN